MSESNKAYDLVMGFFNDKDKTRLWFATPNPMLGNIKPNDLIKLGREDKLTEVIESMLNGNHV